MAHLKIYRCDSCGKDVPSQDKLKPVYIEWGPARKTRGYYSSPKRDGIRIDVCSGSCLGKLGAALLPFIGEKGHDSLIPPPKKPKTQATLSPPKKKASA